MNFSSQKTTKYLKCETKFECKQLGGYFNPKKYFNLLNFQVIYFQTLYQSYPSYATLRTSNRNLFWVNASLKALSSRCYTTSTRHAYDMSFECCRHIFECRDSHGAVRHVRDTTTRIHVAGQHYYPVAGQHLLRDLARLLVKMAGERDINLKITTEVEKFPCLVIL